MTEALKFIINNNAKNECINGSSSKLPIRSYFEPFGTGLIVINISAV
jgi:hypothetical protein